MPEKFSIEQKEQIVIESFTATNMAELCRRHGVSVAQFHRWKENVSLEDEKTVQN